jgi:hypothetical protein
MQHKVTFVSVAFLILILMVVYPLSDLMPRNLRSEAAPFLTKDSSAVFARLPILFIKNKGQLDKSVEYYVKTTAQTLYFTRDGVAFDLTRYNRAEAINPDCRQAERLVFSLDFLGANSQPVIDGTVKDNAVANYFIGNDPEKWRTDIPTYIEVVYRDIYPAIDLILRGKDNVLEYEFVVRPGASPDDIALAYNGIDSLSIQNDNLLIGTAFGPMRQYKPYIYQQIGNETRKVAGGFRLGRGNSYGFYVAAYDNRYPLIIDPTLAYSTYLGSNGNDQGFGIAVDQAGSAYVTGFTDSTNFPTQIPSQGTYAGGFSDVFVAKLSPAGNSLVYSTYLGGSGIDEGHGIAVDSAGSAYVTGATSSSDFPTQNPYQATNAGGFDVFVTKLSPAGNSLIYSTYIGGFNSDIGRAIAVDSTGSAYITGYSSAITNYPTKNPFQGANAGHIDAIVTKLSPAGNSLIYSTFFGGHADDFGDGIAVDSTGSAYIVGTTNSDNLITWNAFQATKGGGFDAFVVKFSPAGNSLAYSTYLGGTGADTGNGIAVDAAGSAYVTGFTSSSNFPTQNPYQGTIAGGVNAYVTKLSPAGNSLVYSTYLGGSGGDTGNGIAVDAAGSAYVTGFTSSTDFPTENPSQGTNAGGVDAFVARLSAAGNSLAYATYLGGSGDDEANGIAMDAAGSAYVTGFTNSSDFPTRNPYQGTFAGVFDAFVAKLAQIQPTVTTNAATNVGTNSATLNMSFTVGEFSPVEVRFAYRSGADPTWSYTAFVSEAAAGTQAETVSGLLAGIQYDFKAQLKYLANVIDGQTLQFVTVSPKQHRVSPSLPRQLNQAQVSVQYLNVSPQQTYANQPVTITTNVVNTGDQAGNLNVALKINGQVEQTRMVSVGPQATQPIKFTVTKAQPGTYAIDIGGQTSSFTILGTGGTTGKPVNGGMIALIVMVVLILATAVVLMMTFRRPA